MIMVIMTKIGGMQHRCRSLQQERKLTSITRKSFLSFVIRMFMCCIVFSCIFKSVSSETGCLNKEIKSLLAFKSRLHDPAGCLASWSVPLCSCEWKGVHCDRQTRHVIAVDLHNCSLSGTFHPALLIELRDLETLDVSSNNFTSQLIPQELGLLKKLAYLNLSKAGFTGTIPWQLGNLSSLTVLDLSSSEHSTLRSDDLSWLTNLTALKQLRLDGMDLSVASSSWGQSVGRLSQLRNLTMSNCGLTGAIPSSLQNLASLEILHLDGNDFNSEFPSWLANMASLVSLQMSNASLNGSLPFEHLSQLPHLERIYLGLNNMSGNVSQIFQGPWKSLNLFQMPNNILEGSIPESIGNISSLVMLDLTRNKLMGNIPDSLSRLSSLTELDLGYNSLMGPIPLSLGLLSKLTKISLTDNKFSGPISESHFSGLNNLKYLVLSDNDFTIKIASNWNPPFQLAVLKLSHCKIEGTLPPFLKTQLSLRELDLSNNTLTGQIPRWLWNLPKLESVLLSHNQLEGPIPQQLYNSTSLNHVELRDNHLDGTLANAAPSYAAGFPLELDLSINNIRGPIPSEICMMLKGSRFLSLASNKLDGQIPHCIWNQTEALDLSGNKLHGKLPSHFGNSSSLKVLNVANNSLEGQIPVELGKLKKLQVLHINDNRLSGHVPSSLQNCKMLEILDLGGNYLSGNVPEWIADLSKLRILVLRKNYFEGEIPIQIGSLPNLQILDLAINHLSGRIPQSLSNLSVWKNEDFTRSLATVLKYGNYYKEEVHLMIKGHERAYKYGLSPVTCLDLSANSLTGDIPQDIGDLKGLQTLNVSYNLLTGHIPPKLGKMVDLEALDMSSNQLEGRIPATLGGLTFLGYLDLSNNNLSGRIPYIGQLGTFDAPSFSDNPELCGPPLNQNCSDQASVESDDSEQSADWWESWEVGMGLGSGIGFGSIIAVLALSRRLWIKYCHVADNFMRCLMEVLGI